MASPWASQAAKDALLKYAPQQSVLQRLMREAEEGYKSTVAGGAGTARETIQSVRESTPAVARIYAGANAAQQAGTSLLGKDLAALPNVANSIKAGSVNEAAQQLANLNASRTQALTDLQGRKVQAAEGAQFAQQNAAGVLRKELTKLFGKSQELAGEQGSFAATEQEKLAHEAEKLQQSERQNLRSVGQREKSSERSAAVRRETAAGRAGGGYLKLSEQNEAADTVAAIKELASKYASHWQKAGHPYERSHLVEILSEGSPSEEVGTGRKNSEGKEVKEKLPAIPAYTPNVLMSAALDVVEHGYLTPGTQQRLQHAGYSVHALGLPSANEGRARVEQQGGAEGAAKKVAQALSGF